MPGGKRIGVAQGRFDVPESIDTSNDELVSHFAGVLHGSVVKYENPLEPVDVDWEAGQFAGNDRDSAELIERVNASTKDASGALDDALSSVEESNKRIAALEKGAR